MRTPTCMETRYGARFSTEIYTEDAIGSRAFALLQASRCVTNGISIGCSLHLPVHTVNCVKTLKDRIFHNPPVSERQGGSDARCSVFGRLACHRGVVLGFHNVAGVCKPRCICSNRMPYGRSTLLTVAATTSVTPLKAPSIYTNHELCHHVDDITHH
jgi:hypothetical protein